MVKWAQKVGWPLIRRTAREWREDDGQVLASSMAYYAAFSFMPLMLFLLAVLGFALTFSSRAQEARQDVLEILGRHTSIPMKQQVETVMDEVQNTARLNGPIGLAILMYGAANVFVRLDTALVRIWKLPEAKQAGRGFFAAALDLVLHRLKAFLVLLVVGLLLISAFVGSIVLSAVHPYLSGFPGSELSWRGLQVSAGVAFHTLVFTMLYKGLAKRDVLWRETLAGGLFAGLSWEVVRQVLALFIVAGRFSAYGVIGSFIAIMLWFYVSAALLLIGAEFVQVLASSRNERQRVPVD